MHAAAEDNSHGDWSDPAEIHQQDNNQLACRVQGGSQVTGQADCRDGAGGFVCQIQQGASFVVIEHKNARQKDQHTCHCHGQRLFDRAVRNVFLKDDKMPVPFYGRPCTQDEQGGC